VSQARCPTCRNLFETDYSVSMPFCCERCRQVDLGKWLDEELSMPIDIEGALEQQANNPHEIDDPDDELS